jgi:hypothetical protein
LQVLRNVWIRPDTHDFTPADTVIQLAAGILEGLLDRSFLSTDLTLLQETILSTLLSPQERDALPDDGGAKKGRLVPSIRKVSIRC